MLVSTVLGSPELSRLARTCGQYTADRVRLKTNGRLSQLSPSFRGWDTALEVSTLRATTEDGFAGHPQR